MSPTRRLPAWSALLLALLGLTALYAGPLRTRFLNDDYMFLEEARTRPLLESLTRLGPLGNYYRPLSRQIYFEVLTPIAGGHPLVFHLANYLVFLGALALLAHLLRVFLPLAGAMAGCLYFALLPLQRVNLTWVSCSQDLLALLGALGSVALYRRGRTGPALLAYLAAITSKEAALPLPALLAAWSILVDRTGWRRAVLRATPFAALGLVWIEVAHAIISSHGASALLRFDLAHFLAGHVHMIQSLLGLEAPDGMLQSLARHAPSLLALIFLAPLAWWYERSGRDPSASEESSRPGAAVAAGRVVSDLASGAWRRRALGVALVWLAAFGFVTGPVASTWSSYYYTLAAVGGALIAGLLLARGDRWTWLLTLGVMLWWHAGATQVRAFAITDRPWTWTSHLTSFYFQRAAALTDTLSRQLRTLEPAPLHETRFFFATLPPWAGFQMGNGPLIRDLYHDLTLQSFFYSQFSESTAADKPVRFLYWDGARLHHLYPHNRDLFFQVGSDLLLLDRPAGAVHAFRRGLAEGGNRMDYLYWLGWAYLWTGNRGAAEATWKEFGAVDDSLFWRAHLRAAHNALVDGDTLEARRHLIRAIEYGIGRPEAHAVLGELLAAERPKYAVLELKVATWLNPRDWEARRSLALGLARARLDDAARREFQELARIYPQWRSDSTVVQTWRRLEARNAVGQTVVKF